jgi:hypothetical protein
VTRQVCGLLSFVWPVSLLVLAVPGAVECSELEHGCAVRWAGQAGCACPFGCPCCEAAETSPGSGAGRGYIAPESRRRREAPFGAGGAAPWPAPRTAADRNGYGVAVSVVDASRGGEGVSRKRGDFSVLGHRRSSAAGGAARPPLARRPAGDRCRTARHPGARRSRRGWPAVAPAGTSTRRRRSASSRCTGPRPTRRPAGETTPQPTKLLSSGAGNCNFVGCGEHRQSAAGVEPRGPDRARSRPPTRRRPPPPVTVKTPYRSAANRTPRHPHKPDENLSLAGAGPGRRVAADLTRHEIGCKPDASRDWLQT